MMKLLFTYLTAVLLLVAAPDSILASSVADIDASASFLLDSRRALHHTADAYSTSKRALLQSGTAVKARVVNGWDAQPDQYPYTAYLRMQTNCLASGGAITNAPQQPLSSRSSSAVTGRLTMLCGASLIMPRVLLTAGHCMYKCSSSQAADSLPHEIPTTENDFITWGGPIDIFLNQYNISIPTSEVPGAEARNASGAVRNPKFLSVGNIPREYDAALIWFDEPSEVTPIQLNLNPKFDVGQQFMVAGWGYTKPDTFSVSQTLKTAQVPYVPLPLCSAKFNETVWKGDICAGANPANYMDTCAGDSGGPLMMNVSTPANGYPQILAGITSYGESCANSYPGVYTNAALQADWIDQSITLKNIGGLEIPRIGCASHTGQRYTGTGVTTFFKISNAAQCCNVCKVNSTSCRAWAWHKATKRCQVMTAVTGRSLSSSWTSGNVTGAIPAKQSYCEMEYYVSYSDPAGTQTLKTYTTGTPATSAAACCAACQKNTACKNMSYNGQSNTCVLFAGPSRVKGWGRRAWQYDYMSGLVSRR